MTAAEVGAERAERPLGAGQAVVRVEYVPGGVPPFVDLVDHVAVAVVVGMERIGCGCCGVGASCILCTNLGDRVDLANDFDVSTCLSFEVITCLAEHLAWRIQ